MPKALKEEPVEADKPSDPLTKPVAKTPKVLRERLIAFAFTRYNKNTKGIQRFGKDNFNNTSEFLRKELDILCLKNYSPKEWLDENIQLLSDG